MRVHSSLLALLLAGAAFTLSGCSGNQNNTPQDGKTKVTRASGNVQGDPAGNKLTISGARGTFNVDFSKSAFLRDRKPIKQSEVQEGDFIMVEGLMESSILKADKVHLIRKKGPNLPPRAVGGSPGG